MKSFLTIICALLVTGIAVSAQTSPASTTTTTTATQTQTSDTTTTATTTTSRFYAHFATCHREVRDNARVDFLWGSNTVNKAFLIRFGGAILTCACAMAGVTTVAR